MADIAENAYGWSTTAASNSPSGATTIGAGLDDNLRAIQAGVRALFTPLGTVAGTNTITAVAAKTLTAYASGNEFTLVPANTNTGATTINIDGLGAKNIFVAGKACIGGELRAGVPTRIVYDGTQFNADPSGALRIVKRKTADESVTSSTTLQDDDHLNFAIAASEEWVATFELDMANALSTTGLKVAVTFPASATVKYSVTLHPDFSTDGAGGGRYYKTTTTGGAALDFTTGNLVSVTNAHVRVTVWVLNSTNAGTVQLQFAQSTSSGTAVTSAKGGYMTAERVA